VVLRNGRSQPEHMKNMVILGGRQCLSLLLTFCLFNILILILLDLCSDIVFSNKLVVYDLENQVIGWTDHDCEILA
jgi:hypothetical protein